MSEDDDDGSGRGPPEPSVSVDPRHAKESSVTDIQSNPNFGNTYKSLRSVGREQPQNIDWPVYGEALRTAGLHPAGLRTLSWGRFSETQIAALTESTTLIGVFDEAVFECVGKRHLFGRSPKYRLIDFTQVRAFAAEDYVVEHHRIYKFGIEFNGYGGVLLGRLEWHVQAKRFADSRQEIMATAQERDRVLEVVQQILGD
jgi:hypothetical protein